MNEQPVLPRLVSVGVASRMLGLTPRWVQMLAKQRKLPCALVDDGYRGQFVFLRTRVETLAQERAAKKAKRAA